MSQPPVHFHQSLAGKTLLWQGTDTEERYIRNLSRPEFKHKIDSMTWALKGLDYTYNSQGFRDKEFDQQPSVLALGCSHTEGVGLPAWACWPSQLENLIGIKVWNLGLGGTSIDTCFRLLDYWIHHLNVKAVCCLVPEAWRFEIYNNSVWVNVLPSVVDSTMPEWVREYSKHYYSNSENFLLNRRKNLMAMSWLCAEKQVPFYSHNFDPSEIRDRARDLLHAGPVTAEKIARKFYDTMGDIQNATR